MHACKASLSDAVTKQPKSVLRTECAKASRAFRHASVSADIARPEPAADAQWCFVTDWQIHKRGESGLIEWSVLWAQKAADSVKNTFLCETFERSRCPC